MDQTLAFIILGPMSLAFFLQSMDILPYWGKEPTNKTEVVFGREQSVWVFKNWRKWLWIEVLLSPIFIIAYVGVGMFFVFGFIMIGLIMNPFSKWLGKKIESALSAQISKS